MDGRDPGEATNPLSAQLSWALVALTVELDNEFEHNMPHRTTNHGSAGGAEAPWLVSFPMWAHCIRHVPEEGISAGELVRRSRLTPKAIQMIVKRLATWWDYLRVDAPTDSIASGRKASPATRIVRLSKAGRRAREIWLPLETQIEARWRDRFGQEVIKRLRQDLGAFAERLDLELPDYLPIGEARLQKRTQQGDETGDELPALSTLLSRVLFAFALDFDTQSEMNLGVYTTQSAAGLAISATVLRSIDEDGSRVAQVPTHCGVAKMTVDNWLGALTQRGYLTVGQSSPNRHFKAVTPTDKGRHAQELYRRWTNDVENRLDDRLGAVVCPDLRKALEPITQDVARLRLGMEPYADGWRAQVPRLDALADFPVISVRGGFPDGS